jgi:cystathionine beta-synthase
MIELIGNTPIVELKIKSKHKILAKCEFLNPTGSIKDRVAKYIIEHLKQTGELKKYQTIVEASSGNMGTSLAAIGKHYEHPVHITCPSKTGIMKRKMITAFGGDLTICKNTTDHNDSEYYVNKAKTISQYTNGVIINQYDSLLNTECHYYTTGAEIVKYLKENNIHLDYFITVGGSGGTVTGCAKAIKEHSPTTKIVMPDPFGSVYYDIFHKGKINKSNIYSYKVEGPGNPTYCKAMDLAYIDDVIQFTDDNAINGCLNIAKYHGLYTGHSSGANYYIANNLIQSFVESKPKTILILLLDSGMKYDF